MSTQSLLVRLTKLVVVLCLLIGAHALLHEFGADRIAELTAPKYVPLTPAEETDFRQRNARLAQEWLDGYEERCRNLNFQGRLQDDLLKACLQEGARVRVSGELPRYGVPYYPHPSQVHNEQEIAPRIKLLQETVLPWTFGVLYALLGLFILQSFWRWTAGTAIPAVRKLSTSVMSISLNGGDFFANRRINAAVRHLEDLDKLFERGMISEDELLKRKAQLKERLSPVSRR